MTRLTLFSYSRIRFANQQSLAVTYSKSKSEHLQTSDGVVDLFHRQVAGQDSVVAPEHHGTGDASTGKQNPGWNRFRVSRNRLGQHGQEHDGRRFREMKVFLVPEFFADEDWHEAEHGGHHDDDQPVQIN